MEFLARARSLAVTGVVAAARVGQYSASLSSSGRSASGQVFGIDRADFSQVAFFRDDFAAEPLNGLLNRLAASPDAVLVDQGTWERFSLHTGDTDHAADRPERPSRSISPARLSASLRAFPPGQWSVMERCLSPTWTRIFEAAGSIQPYAVWLRTTPQANTQEIVNGINQTGRSSHYRSGRAGAVAAGGANAGAAGRAGHALCGFLAATGLTTISVLLYVLFSFRERTIQLGVLRAIGMNARQMRRALVAELAFLVGCSLLLGAALGAFAVMLYVPYLPVQSGAGVRCAAARQPSCLAGHRADCAVVRRRIWCGDRAAHRFTTPDESLSSHQNGRNRVAQGEVCMHRIKLWFSIFIIILLLTACSSAGTKATPTLVPTPVTVEKPVYTVQRGTVTRTVQLTGRVTPIQQQDLFFRSDGIVKEVLVQAGDPVQVGDVLARLDEPEQYQADAAAAELAYVQAQRNLEQVTFDTPVKLAEAKQALEKARKELEKAQGSRGRAAVSAHHGQFDAG